MKKTIKLKKDRKSAEELMKAVIDETLLKKRKEENDKKNEIKVVDEIKEEKRELKWYEKPILEKDFEYKEVNGEFYAHHKEWNKRIWIGGYPSECEAKKIVKDYCKECKKNVLERNIKNIHSILFDE